MIVFFGSAQRVKYWISTLLSLISKSVDGCVCCTFLLNVICTRFFFYLRGSRSLMVSDAGSVQGWHCLSVCYFQLTPCDAPRALIYRNCFDSFLFERGHAQSSNLPFLCPSCFLFAVWFGAPVCVIIYCYRDSPLETHRGDKHSVLQLL